MTDIAHTMLAQIVQCKNTLYNIQTHCTIYKHIVQLTMLFFPQCSKGLYNCYTILLRIVKQCVYSSINIRIWAAFGQLPLASLGLNGLGNIPSMLEYA